MYPHAGRAGRNWSEREREGRKSGERFRFQEGRDRSQYRDSERDRQTETEAERVSQLATVSDWLFNILPTAQLTSGHRDRGNDRDRDRQADRQTDRERERDRSRESQ